MFVIETELISNSRFMCFQNGLQELKKLIKFLDVDFEDDLKKNILDMCEFKKMSSKESGPDGPRYFKDGFTFFRKGN